MQNSEIKVGRRITAFLLDILLLYFIISLITSIRFINLSYDKYNEYYEKYSNVLEDYYDNNIDENEMIEQNKDNFYYLTKYSINYNIVIIVVLIGYFVLFQKFNKGQTLGKKIMKIKVVNENDSEASLGSYFLRTLPMYYIFIGGILPLLINSILVFVLNSSSYFIVNSMVSYLFLFIFIVDVVFILVRKDKRSIHEIISKTKLIDEKEI